MHIRRRVAARGDGSHMRRRRGVALLTLAAVVLLGSAPLGRASAGTAADALTTCYRATTLDAATKTCDPPTAIVDATYRTCVREEENWREALFKAGGVYGSNLAANVFNRFKANSRGILLTMITKTRTEKGLCK